MRSTAVVGISAGSGGQVADTSGPVANASEPLRFPAASGGEVETGSAWSCLHTQARMRRDVDSSRPRAPSFLQRDDPPGGTGISRAVASEAAGHKAPQRREKIAWGATGHWARSCRNIAVFEWLPGSRVPRTTWTSSWHARLVMTERSSDYRACQVSGRVLTSFLSHLFPCHGAAPFRGQAEKLKCSRSCRDLRCVFWLMHL